MAHRRPRAQCGHGGANLRARHLGSRTSNGGHAARRLGRSDRDWRKPMNAIQRNLTVNSRRPRSARYQHHQDADDRCRAEGQLGPPGRGHGPGAARLHALESHHALRSSRSDLAESRPLRPLQWSCLDAAVVNPALDPDSCGERELRDRWELRPLPSMRSSAFASSIARRPATRNIIGFPASRPPQVLSVRA